MVRRFLKRRRAREENKRRAEVRSYKVTKVVGDTVFVDFSIMIASLAWIGGDFIYYPLGQSP